jgi:glutamate-5-semialdehyde dehydrogenase
MDIIQAAKDAKKASIELSALNAEQKNKALSFIAESIVLNKNEIFEKNEIDLKRSENENLPEPLLKRLKFDERKLSETVEGIRSLIGLSDPVGKTLLATELDNGLELYKISCPIGVIGVIFESRPDALVQISTLCLKSGNTVLLKGGSEAIETNRILAKIIYEAANQAGVPSGWIHLLETREDVNNMLALDKWIDLIIPRGSNDFVRYIMDHSKIPVLGHSDGICHCYVDKDADINMAVDVVNDSKTQYVAVCNATETLLVHSDIAASFLPKLKKKTDQKNVILMACE